MPPAQPRREALDLTPVRSLMCFQLFADHHTVAALSFYAERPGAFDEDALGVGLIFATHVALAWRLLRRDHPFRTALASRDVIGLAKGMLMERYGVDAVQAFELLRRLSQNSNTPVVGVAHDIAENR